MDNLPVDQLSSMQAQHALLVFYDLLPAALWSGGKPSRAELEAASEDMQDAASGQDAAVIQALLEDGNEELKGEASRSLLLQFQRSKELRPLVDQAVAQALEPDMALPVLIGVFVLSLAVLPDIDYRKDGDKEKIYVTWHPAKNACKLMDKLTGLVKALPAAVLQTLT